MKLFDKVLEKLGIFSKEFEESLLEKPENSLENYEKDLEETSESFEKVERNVGEKFNYKGTMLEVIEDTEDFYTCETCFFGKDCTHLRDINLVGSCLETRRSDNKGVHFKQIEDNKATVENTEGMKFDTGKLSYTLLPFKAITEVVKVLEFGKQKYSKDNWQKVANAKERYNDACLRHYISYIEGETLDQESGLHHLAHATCCLLFVLWFDLTGQREKD